MRYDKFEVGNIISIKGIYYEITGIEEISSGILECIEANAFSEEIEVNANDVDLMWTFKEPKQ